MTLRLEYKEWIKRGCPSAIVTIRYEMKGNEQMYCPQCGRSPETDFNRCVSCRYYCICSEDFQPANCPVHKRKSQMTRKEAWKKLNAGRGSEADRVLNYLEALGLIKFDKCEETVEKLLVRCGYPSADRILMILSDNGYDVVKR